MKSELRTEKKRHDSDKGQYRGHLTILKYGENFARDNKPKGMTTRMIAINCNMIYTDKQNRYTMSDRI